MTLAIVLALLMYEFVSGCCIQLRLGADGRPFAFASCLFTCDTNTFSLTDTPCMTL